MLDLNKYKLDEALPFNLVDPKTGTQLDAKIWIHSFHSKKSNDIVLEHHRTRKEGDPAISDADVVPLLIEKWENIAVGKKKLECTPENVKDVLSKHSWIFKQCMLAINTGEYSPKH